MPDDTTTYGSDRDAISRGTTAEDLRREMASVRSSLASDVEQVTANARDLTDWKYYVKQHPLPLAAAAAAFGYLMVPRETKVVRPSPETLRRMAKNKKVYISNKPQKASKDRNMLDRALSIGGAFAARAATAYVTQQLGALTGHAASESTERGPQRGPQPRR